MSQSPQLRWLSLHSNQCKNLGLHGHSGEGGWCTTACIRVFVLEMWSWPSWWCWVSCQWGFPAYEILCKFCRQKWQHAVNASKKVVGAPHCNYTKNTWISRKSRTPYRWIRAPALSVVHCAFRDKKKHSSALHSAWRSNLLQFVFWQTNYLKWLNEASRMCYQLFRLSSSAWLTI